MRNLVASWVVMATFSAIGCGPQPAPEGPFILTDRAALGFGVEFDTGTVIGTSVTESISVTNKGLSDLIISDVTQAGDGAFGFRLTGQNMGQPPSTVLPLTVTGKKQTFIQVTFTPTQVRKYAGSVTIKSNAENVKDLTVALTGCGVRRLDGGFEIPDGGCLP